MYKYCPHCGKPFLEPDKPRTVGLVSQVKEFITWAQIKEWSGLREASKHFEIGDEIHDELKTGEPITLVVVEKDKPFDGDVMFMLKDCLRDTYPMNDDYTNAGGWKASKLRKVLNSDILALLPDDMRAAIKPRVIDGESDLLWLASEMEVFGPHDWTENDPDRGEQMAYYKRRGNRIKALGDEGESAHNWWERSPFANGATVFCYVSSNGDAYVNSANYPDGDTSILECPCCGSGEWLHNADESQANFCGQCGQAIDWTEPEVHCGDCEHLTFSDCYGECGKGYKGIVQPGDSCGKGVAKKHDNTASS